MRWAGQYYLLEHRGHGRLSIAGGTGVLGRMRLQSDRDLPSKKATIAEKCQRLFIGSQGWPVLSCLPRRKEEPMKLSQIAAALRKAAAGMEVFAVMNDDLDYADEAVLPFVMNFLTDQGLRKFPPWVPARTQDPQPRS